jgi:hypothetical protein
MEPVDHTSRGAVMNREIVSANEFLRTSLETPNVDEIANLPPEKRKDYGRLIVHEYLRKHPEGAVVDQVAAATGLSRKTVYGHLEILCALRKAYRRDWGPRRIVYYPMDTGLGARPDSSIQIGDEIFTFRQVENQFGQFVYVQERTKDSSGAATTRGGILVPLAGVTIFAKKLREYTEE